MFTETFVRGLDYLLALGTVLTQIASVAVLVLYFLRNRGERFSATSSLIGRYGVFLSFFLFFVSMALSLFYSEILGFKPCSLCWLQRVFMYPQVFLLWLALYKKERAIADYSIALSIPGALVAIYQHYLQMGGGAFLPCLANSDLLDCSTRTFFEFGYVTYPLMAFTAFIFSIALMLHVRAGREEKDEA